MPEISSLPALPALVAPVAVAGPAPAAPVGSEAPGEGFLAQLKTALAGLANAAMPRILTGTQSTVEPALPKQAVTDEPHTDDRSKDVMPEILAALGFVPVPLVMQPRLEQAAEAPQPVATQPVARQTVAAQPVAAQQVASQPVANQPLPNPIAGAPRPQTPHSASAAASTHAAESDAHTASAVTAAAPAPAPAAEQPATLDPRALADLPKDNTVKLTPVAPHEMRAHAPQPERSRSGDTAPRQNDALQAVASLVDDAPVMRAPATQHAAQQSSDQQSQSGSTFAEELAPAKTSSEPASSTSEIASPEPQVDAAAAGITAPPQVAHAAMPTHVQPSHVVNQIAQQADLYRLPGNRGVRIQLHPEDLGGLDVTLRYSPTGGIQLHISAEHASTGALVQAGWHELRDALATQGITPDRLVMSVSAPASAGGSNFSSNGGDANRQDAGLASFTQGGNGQGGQRQDDEPRRVSRAWFGDAESTSTSDEQAAPARASTATDVRIDYRV